MRKWNLLLAGVAILMTVIVFTHSRSGRAAPAGPAPTPIPATSADQAALQAALDAAAQDNQKAVPAFILYKVAVDHAEVSQDGRTALVWMALIDPESNQALATEPGLAVGERDNSNSPWKITLPTSPDWQQKVQALPEGLLNGDQKAQFLPVEQNTKLAATDQVYHGYLLPWEGGKRVWLTGSVAHFTTYNSCSWVTVNGDTHSTCRYAFDFSDGTMFRVLASRGGTVVGARWTCTNSDHSCLNYIALEDRTTNPVTTALYLHLAQNSIPAALRVNGTYVNQGDFLALADNTGLSTGNHLHFMVVGNRWLASGYGGTFWWGDSVDISFDDVSINGGRPRMCSEVYYTPQYGTECQPKNPAVGEYYDNWFISGNRGPTPPTAILTGPAAYTTITTPNLAVSGSAKDNTGVAKIQVIANYDNNWVEVGAPITANPFNTNVDFCSSSVPNGPVTIALWAWDVEGNRTPLPQDPRPILKNTTCPAPAPKCSPGPDQVALYSQPDYQGACQVFGVGKYDATQFGPVGDNQTASIQVGANVMGVLYDGSYSSGVLQGRSEAFLSNDAGLSDNRIGAGKASSLEVKARAKPSAPILRAVYNRVDGSSNPIAPSQNESILLIWKSDYTSYPPDEGGTEYQAELSGPNGLYSVSGWQMANTWSVGSLAAGNYTWKVTARNLMGESSATASFTVTAAAAPGGTALQVPFSDAMNNGVNGWVADGLWHQATPPTYTNNNTSTAWGFSSGSDYADGFVAGGSLTSPPIAVPAGGAQLSFRYASQTEDNGRYWDQRWVQISENGGAFQNVLQLTDDPIGEWQSSPFINLAPYAGKTVRVRFYFNVVDKYNNGLLGGWWIDDFSVAATGGDASCAETASNDQPASATPIALNQSISAVICPAGDVDYYQFSAVSGTSIAVDVVAKAEGSSLDPYLYLLDGDGSSVLAENDDIQYGVVQDSHLVYTIQRTGSYYLKVKAYNNPGVGGPGYTYRIVLAGDDQPPIVQFTNPVNSWVGPNAFNLQAYAADGQGVARVDFYWHSADWRNGSWDLLGSDTTPADGWKAAFNPATRNIPGSILVARAYDVAGLESAAVLWNLQIDQTAPVTAMQGLPGSTLSTAVQLKWSGGDAETGLNHFELQVQDNGGAWTTWNNAIPPQQNAIYYPGVAGHTYGFRLRGVDNAGNAEAFPGASEATTKIAATCAPDAFDSTQPSDNTVANAALLPIGQLQEHNLCPANDMDWVKFNAQAGNSYLVRVASLSGGAAASILVTDPSGQTVYAQATAGQWGSDTILKFDPPADGEYRVRVMPFDNRLWGTDARYGIYVAPAKWEYLPVVGQNR